MAYGYGRGGRGYGGRKSFARKSYAKKSGKGYGNSWGAYGYANMAKTALRTAKFVASLVNTEKKVIDSNVAQVSVYNAGWGITPLTLVAQGDDYNQRQGRSIKVTDIDMRGIVKVNTGLKGAMFRYMIISDNASDGTILDMTEVLNTAAGSDPAVYTFRNVATASVARYTVLKDKILTLNPNGAQELSIQCHKNLQHHVKFIGTTSGQASSGAGTLYLCYIATGAIAADGVLFESQQRVRFIDN